MKRMISLRKLFHNSHKVLFAAILLSLGLIVSGCQGGPDDQPEIGQVSGIVTLDEKPLAGAQVEFEPQEGRPSTGTTDENGFYELKYSQDEPGAKVGEHTVKITTFTYAKPDEKEKVPSKYNSDTTLKETVKPGKNDIPFELYSN